MNKKVIEIRQISDLAGFAECISLQQRVWGDSPAELVPQHIYVVAKKTGGQVIGAYDGEKLVGYLLAFVGQDGNHCYLHSHMTGVDADYRDFGVGRQLKLCQREEALKNGINKVVWTFDPFKPRNAYFNLMKLGAYVKTFLPDVYGITTSHFDAGLPTDRLLAEWILDSPRVERAINGAPVTFPDDCIELPVTPAGSAQDKYAFRENFVKLLENGYRATGIRRDGSDFSYVFQRFSEEIEREIS